jgi:hypothetical protein
MRRVWLAVPVVVSLLLATGAGATTLGTGTAVMSNVPGTETLQVPWTFTDEGPSSDPYVLNYGLQNWVGMSAGALINAFQVSTWETNQLPIGDTVTHVAVGNGAWVAISTAALDEVNAVTVTGDMTGDGTNEVWKVYWSDNSYTVLYFAAVAAGQNPDAINVGQINGPGLGSPVAPSEGFHVAFTAPGYQPGWLIDHGLSGAGPVPGPEPGAMALLALGLPGVAFGLVRRKRSK